MDHAFISKMHAADLCSKYAYQGLDLSEMRAVFASTPETFQNDGNGMKKKVCFMSPTAGPTAPTAPAILSPSTPHPHALPVPA